MNSGGYGGANPMPLIVLIAIIGMLTAPGLFLGLFVIATVIIIVCAALAGRR